jgi:hypothetical protein
MGPRLLRITQTDARNNVVSLAVPIVVNPLSDRREATDRSNSATGRDHGGRPTDRRSHAEMSVRPLTADRPTRLPQAQAGVCPTSAETPGVVRSGREFSRGADACSSSPAAVRRPKPALLLVEGAVVDSA